MKMKFTTVLVGLFSLVFLGIGVANVSAESVLLPQRHPRVNQAKRIVVKMRNKPAVAALLSLSASVPGATFEGGIPNSTVVIYKINNNPQDALRKAKLNSSVETAYIPAVISAFEQANDSDFSLQWNLLNTKVGDPTSGVDTAWDHLGNSTSEINSATSGIKVAILDTGVDLSHADLSGKIIASVTCLSGSCVSGGDDDHGHGSHVAGIIAAATNNSRNVAGAGWGVKIVSAKILDNLGSGDTATLIRGIDWAISQNVDIINMSLGVNEGNLNTSEKTDVQNAIIRARNAGILLIAAAGNCGEVNSCDIYDNNNNVIGHETNPKMYPAAFDDVVSVAALTKSNQLASYSEHNDASHGNWVDVAAPGGQCCIGYTNPELCPNTERAMCVISLYKNGGSVFMAGTSQASPLVSGIAALLFSKKSDLSPSQIRSLLENTADPSWGGNASIHGGVNALAAIVSLENAVPPTSTPTPTGSSNPTATPTPIQPTATPFPTVTAYPTTGVPNLLKVAPIPYPSGPYCPVPSANCSSKERGDANCDGVINEADYEVWRIQYNTLVPYQSSSNANFSCVEGNSSTYWADLSDYEIWRRNTSSFSVNPTATPTPLGDPTATPTPLENPTATPTPLDASPTVTPAPTVIPGLVSFWKMDETSGSTVADETGRNPGIAVEATIQGGKAGNSRRFDGDNDMITLGTNESLNNLAALSICAWILPRSYGEIDRGRIYAKALKEWFSLEDNGATANKTLRFGVKYTGDDLRVSAVDNFIALDTWQFVCVTWNGSVNPNGVKFYKNNGEEPSSYQERSTAVGSRLDDSTTEATIGNGSGGVRTFKGRIDEVRVYNTVLSKSEIQTLYSSYQ